METGAVNDEVGLNVAVSAGIVTEAQAKRFAEVGVHRYNHNLETAESFFANVVTTHTWAERFAYDAYYVDNQSTRLDLRIIARTVAVVFQGGGTRSEGHVTNPEFGV
jgi:lipopolysaccharide/colanic/teichoic acid biosynthesis glycosyltransferase